MNIQRRTAKRPPRPDEVRRMTSRYNSTCRVCGDPIRAGEIINYSRVGGPSHTICRRLNIERLNRETL